MPRMWVLVLRHGPTSAVIPRSWFWTFLECGFQLWLFIIARNFLVQVKSQEKDHSWLSQFLSTVLQSCFILYSTNAARTVIQIHPSFVCSSHYISLSVLEFSVQIRLTWNSQGSTCLHEHTYLRSPICFFPIGAETKVLHHQTWQNFASIRQCK